MTNPPRPIYEFGPYRLDVGEYRLLRNGQEIKLRPKVMNFLVVLLKRPGQLLTKEELLEEVWPNVEVEESNLPICVKELREVLGSHYIETVATRGYRFTAEVKVLNKLLPQARPIAGPPEKEDGPPVGALPINSRFYIKRPTDDEFCSAILRRDSLVLAKGARQVGKSSLLARALQQARESGATVVLTDFQSLNADTLTTADSLLRSLAEKIAYQLDLDFPSDTWKQFTSPNMNFENYLRRRVLPNTKTLVWGLDEVDRLFAYPYSGDIFGLFRSWHNLRSLEPTGPWGGFTLALTYATEAHLFIKDLNQSPFNVGTRLSLLDFTLAQVIELNGRYGSPLPSAAVSSYFNLLAGHPYLVQCGFYKMAHENLEWATVQTLADRDEGPFGDHLQHMFTSLERNPSLCEAVRIVLRGKGNVGLSDFYRLRSAGVLAGDSPREATLRCELYVTYLRKKLL
jgi:DNA-binding winged helix-turn-helix (wHTH) protein